MILLVVLYILIRLCSMQMFQHVKFLTHIPLIGPLFIPPVNVSSVAKLAVSAATDPAFAPGIIDVYDILQHGLKESAKTS